MRRSAGKFQSEFTEVDLIFGLKTPFTESMLLRVMMGAKAHNPAICGLQSCPSVCPASHMSAFDRQ